MVEKRRWSKEEEELLKELYGSYPVTTIAKILKRTPKSVMRKAERMGLRSFKKDWSLEDLITMLVLRFQYGVKIKDIAKTLGRGESSIRCKLWRLNLTNPVQKWSEEEINLLKNLYGIVDVKDIARYLGRTPEAVKTKASELRLTNRKPKITVPKKLEIVRDYLNGLSIEEIVEKHLHHIKRKYKRPDLVVKRILIKYGAYTPKCRRWSNREVEILREKYKEMDRNELSSLLKRSPKAITNKAYKLGLRKRRRKGRRIKFN